MELVAAGSVDWQSSITDMLKVVTTFLPKLVLFAIVLLVGFFIAKQIRRLITSGLRKINFDAYIDKSGLGAPLERAGFADSGSFVARLVYYIIALTVLKLAFDMLGVDALSEPIDALIAFIPRLIIAIVLLIVGGIVANVVGDIVSGATAGQPFGGMATKVAVISVWFIFGFAAFNELGIAEDIVKTLFTAIIGSLSFIFAIKFGVGGIWAARDRFWPNVYDAVSNSTDDRSQNG